MSNVKKVMGFRTGDFYDSKAGKNRHFVHLYAFFPDDSVTGLRAEVFKCVSDDVLDGVTYGQFVELYFNEYQKVSFINSIEPTKEIKQAFYESDSYEVVED